MADEGVKAMMPLSGETSAPQEKETKRSKEEMLSLNEALTVETTTGSKEMLSPSETITVENAIDIVVDKSRRIVFTDAAVAIALTLLILPLMATAVDVQEKEVTTREWFQTNADLLLTFLLSYSVVALAWTDHVRLFSKVKSFTRLLSFLNFLWLLTITFLPAATNIMNSVTNDATQHFLWIGTVLTAKIFTFLMTIVVHCTPSTWEGDGPSFSLLVSSMVAIVLLVAALLLSTTKGGYFMLLILVLKTPVTSLILWKWPSLKTKWKTSAEPVSSSEASNDGNDESTSKEERIIQRFNYLVETERRIGFVDAAAAIALTLLVLPVMDAGTEARGENLNTIEWFQENKDLMLSFFLSYMVIVKGWSSQDLIMRRIAFFTRILSALTFLWLLAIVLIPVTTVLTTSSKDTFLQHVVYICTPFFATICTFAMTIEGKCRERHAPIPFFLRGAKVTMFCVFPVATTVHRNPGTWQDADSGPKFPLLLDSVVYIVLFLLALVVSFTSAGYLSLLLLILKMPMTMLILWRFPSLRTRW